MLSTTKNESWKLAWNSCSGCHTRMMQAAAAREFSRSCGLFRAQPKMMTVIITVERIAALRATQISVGELSAPAVAEEDRRTRSACRPAVAPGGNCEQHVCQLQPFFSGPVLVAHRSLRIGSLLQNALRNEPLEALGEHLA